MLCPECLRGRGYLGNALCKRCGKKAEERKEQFFDPSNPREKWATQFICPRHGICIAKMVKTTKDCAWCGNFLLRCAVDEQEYEARVAKSKHAVRRVHAPTS